MKHVKQVGALAFTLALSLGPTTHAATLFSQEELEPKGDEQVRVDEQPAVAEGAKVTIGFTLMVPETAKVFPTMSVSILRVKMRSFLLSKTR